MGTGPFDMLPTFFIGERSEAAGNVFAMSDDETSDISRSLEERERETNDGVFRPGVKDAAHRLRSTPQSQHRFINVIL